MTLLLQNIATILGFGFIGLSFLMLFLGYRALRAVVDAPKPSADVVRLARLFLFISLAFLIAAGPLHVALLWMQGQSVMVRISMTNANWDKSFGEIGIWRKGKFVNITDSPHEDEFRNAEDLLVNVDKVVAAIAKMRAQIQAATLAVASPDAGADSGGDGPPPVALENSMANVARDGG
jgi:hypothetical protein